MANYELVLFLVQIGLMLGATLVLAPLSRRGFVSLVVLELIAGILLGPTVFGALSPSLYAHVFPAEGASVVARQTMSTLGLLLFVFVAGLEVNPSRLRSLGLPIFWTSISGIVFPFAMGAGSVLLWPGLWAPNGKGDLTLLAIFAGTVLSISALPVIARILMELNLVRTELGLIVMSAAMVDDLVGWSLFALILRRFQQHDHPGLGAWVGIIPVLALFLLILSVANRRMHGSMKLLKLNVEPWSTRLTVLCVVAAAALAELAGTHAMLGAFVAGAALGRIPEAGEQASKSVRRIVMDFFAPIYFVSVGMQANFARNFDVRLVLLVIFLACMGKIGGVMLGATLAGRDRKQSLVIALGMNARGAMGLVLTSVAFQYKLIDERIFVALVTMCVVTTVLSALCMGSILKPRLTSNQLEVDWAREEGLSDSVSVAVPDAKETR